MQRGVIDNVGVAKGSVGVYLDPSGIFIVTNASAATSSQLFVSVLLLSSSIQTHVPHARPAHHGRGVPRHAGTVRSH